MRYLLFYLLSFFILTACSKSKEKVFYPTKVIVGNTQYDFLYNPNKENRIYSVTITRPKFYETVEYTYNDEHWKEPNHPLKDYIYSSHYSPDKGTSGWDGTDFVISKSNVFFRTDNPKKLSQEWEQKELYKPATADLNTREKRFEFKSDKVRHIYNASNQLTESIYFSDDFLQVQIKRVTYTYNNQGKLAKAAYFAPQAEIPYLVIELGFDDHPGYLRNLPLEAKFMPLELPYRDHNIISYKVTDGQGRVRKDLSYSCTYTYNRNGYPDTFTRKMLDGRKVKGYIVYRTEPKKPIEVAAVN